MEDKFEMLGIDVGATGIKGAIIDVRTGDLLTEKIKYGTPRPATPAQIVKVLKNLIKDFNWKGKNLGIGFPAIIRSGISHSASNIDNKWKNFEILQYLESKLNAKVAVLNDADAAGIAEFKFGFARGRRGTVIMLTLGTGIGSALFINGALVPNTEFGHLMYKKGVTEDYAANSSRVFKDLSWSKWGKEVNRVLEYINFIIPTDLFIMGGGVSKKFSLFEEYLTIDAEVVPAKLLNNAGIIGAACVASKQ